MAEHVITLVWRVEADSHEAAVEQAADAIANGASPDELVEAIETSPQLAELAAYLDTMIASARQLVATTATSLARDLTAEVDRVRDGRLTWSDRPVQAEPAAIVNHATRLHTLTDVAKFLGALVGRGDR